MTLTGNYIDGAWVSPTGDTLHITVDPATGQVLEESTSSSIRDVDRAVLAAHDAFEQWRLIPDAQRGELLFRIAGEIRAARETLGESMTREMGKVLAESLGEVDVVVAHAQFMAGEGRRALGEVLPSVRPNRSISTRRYPRGVVGCITPWNFPLALAAYKIFAALASGNTVVWKPAPNVSHTSRLFLDALERAGVPAGVCNLITGGGAETGEALVAHPQVSVIAFTGSTPVGKSIAEVCARRLAPTLLELGGKNAIIVMEDADLDAAAAGIMQSGFATSGQRCTAASRVIVHEAIEHDILERLEVAINRLRPGNGLDADVTFGPLAMSAQLERVSGLVDRAQHSGAQLITGGKRLDDASTAAGSFFAPTLLTNVSPLDEIAQREVFGPVVAVLRVADIDEAIAANNATDFGLSSAIFTRNLNYALRASDECETGLVYVNSGTSAAEIGVPFGGVKDSGNGHAEVSRHTLDTMTYLRATYLSFEGQQRDL